MDAEEYRRKARYFLALGQQLTRPEDRAAMIEMAALWMQRAEEAEERERIVQQPDKEPEGGGAPSIQYRHRRQSGRRPLCSPSGGEIRNT